MIQEVALVAVGNHLTWPENNLLPSWILPFERDSLFWCMADAGEWALIKTLLASSGLALAFALQVGGRSFTSIAIRWSSGLGIHGLIAKLTLSYFTFMVSQAVGIWSPPSLKKSLIVIFIFGTIIHSFCSGTIEFSY